MKKRNHKFWAIVRIKSKRHYGRKRIKRKAYFQKGKFDYLSYLRANGR